MDDDQTLTRHQRRRMRTRNQLKSATLELLLEKGYDTITVQHITDRADLGRGTFYIHFKDKEDVVWSIVKEGMDATDREARKQIGEQLPPHPEYYGYLNMFRHANQNRDLYRVMLGGQGSSLLTARVHDYLARDLEQEMQNYEIYQDFEAPQGITAQIVTGAIIRLIIWWLETENDYPPEKMAGMLYETIHHQKAPQAD